MQILDWQNMFEVIYTHFQLLLNHFEINWNGNIIENKVAANNITPHKCATLFKLLLSSEG